MALLAPCPTEGPPRLAAHAVCAADLDGDGDVDVLSASRNDDTIAWYESDGASPPSWTTHTITTSANGAHGMFAVDVDGDGDVDVLSASQNDDTIAWYENDDDWTRHVISTAADGARSVFAIDVDGDGDVDALSASYSHDTVAWYENMDGSGGSFGVGGEVEPPRVELPVQCSSCRWARWCSKQCQQHADGRWRCFCGVAAPGCAPRAAVRPPVAARRRRRRSSQRAGCTGPQHQAGAIGASLWRCRPMLHAAEGRTSKVFVARVDRAFRRVGRAASERW